MNFKNVLSFVSTLTGMLVSLLIGFALINKYIIIPHIPITIVIIVGWFVIITTVLSILLAFFNKK